MVIHNISFVSVAQGEGGSPKLRSRKAKRQEARISWPKFPSFSKGRKGFKRSHSTSEAEEQRKLEMSPTTSDTDSPVKSPLKSPDGKEKKKKRLKLKVKMKGLRSKSVEHPTRDEEPTLENVDDVEDQVEQNGTDILSPEEMQPLGEPLVVEQEEAESQESTKDRPEYTFPSLTGPEMETGLHKVELITLDTTLKTTDITVALAEAGLRDKRSPESVKIERSELRVNIQGKDLLDTVNETQIKSSPVSQKDQLTSLRTSDPSTYDSVVISPSVMSHTDFSDHQLNIDTNTQATNQGRTEKTFGHGEMDMSMPPVDVSLDMSDIGLLRKSPRIGGEKQWKDSAAINRPEPESYGIRTRGPLADMATSKATFEAVNDSDLKCTTPKTVISQPKSSPLDMSITDQSKDGTIDMDVPQALVMPMGISIDKVLADISTTEGKVKAEFKLPKVAVPDSNLSELIKMTQMDTDRLQLPSREELEIPGMEDETSTAALQIQGMKLPQIDESDDIKLTNEIRAKRTEIEFNLEDVKAMVAKIPTFKLPRIDMSGIYTHREITPDSDKILGTAGTSPPELSEAKTDVSFKLPDDTMEALIPFIDMKQQVTSSTIKLPNVELPHLDDHEPITVTCIEDSKPKAKSITDGMKTFEGKSVELPKYKLPKREDIEIPGMEAIKKTTAQRPDVKPVLEVKETQKPDTSLFHSTDGQILIPLAPAAEIRMKGTALITEAKIETTPTDKKDKKDKKTKKTKKSTPSFGITKPDIRFPDIGIDFPKQTTSSKKVDDSQVRVDTKMVSPGDEVKIKTPLVVSVDIQKPEMDTSKVREEGEIHVPKVEVPASDIKVHGYGISLPKVKETETAVMETPKSDVSMSQLKTKAVGPSADMESQVTMPEVDVVMPSIDVKGAVGEIYVLESETKDIDIKLKKRKISFPKFSFSRSEVKAPEVSITSPKVDISLPETGVDTEDTDIDATAPEREAPIKDTNISGSPTKFKLPTLKFPKFGMSPQKVHIEPTDVETAIKTPEDEILEVNLLEPELSRSKLPTGALHTSPSAEIAVPYSDAVSKLDGSKHPSTKIEGPELKLSISQPEVEIPSADISITQAKDELKIEKVEGLSAEGKAEPPEMEIKVQEGKGFKLPRFGISIPKMKGPDMDVNVPEADTSLPEVKVDIEQPDVHIPSVTAAIDMPKVDVELPSADVKGASADTDSSFEVEAKESDAKLKKRRISFPKFSFSRSESKVSDVDVEPPKEDITAATVYVKDSETDIKTLEGEAALKDRSSPTKFKLPTLKFPKFGMSPTKVQPQGIDVEVVHSIPEEEILEVTIQEHDLSISGEVPAKELCLTSSANVDISTIDVEAEAAVPQIKMETHEVDTKSAEGSKFKMPKFGISLPKAKGPEIRMSVSKPEAAVSLPEEKFEIQPTDVEIQMTSVEADMDIAHLESKETDIKFKMPKMSFPKFGLAKSEVKSTEIDVTPKLEISLSDGEVKIKDYSLPQSSLEVTSPKAEMAKTEVEGFQLSSNLNLPSIDLSTSGTEITTNVSSLHIDPPQASVPPFDPKRPSADIVHPSVDVALKGSDMAIQPSEILHPKGKVGVKPPKVDGLTVEGDAEAPAINVKGPDGSQFKMPTFGVSVPKVKVPDMSMSVSKPDIDVSEPEVKVEVKVPDSEITAPSIDTELPQAEAKELDAKIKKRRISFPKFGISKQEVKAPEVDITLPKVDVSLPEWEVKEPKADIKILEDSELKDGTGMGSPTKYKLPTFKLPKIGVSASKGVTEVRDVDVGITTAQVSLPEAELKVSGNVPALDGEGSGVDLKIPFIDVAVDTKGPELEVDGSKTIFSTKVEGPEVHVSVSKPDLDVSLPEGKVDVEVPLTQEKVEIPGVDSKGIDMKMKRPGFSFPKFGLSKAEVKAPEVDIPEGKVEVTQADLDVKIPEGEAQLKDINITSPTKFKLPTMKFPKIGVSAPKGTAKVPTVDVDVKAPEVSLTDADLTVSGDVPVVDVEGQGTLPKVSASKTDLDISLSGGKTDIETPLAEGKEDLPDIKAKKPGFSFPKFGFSKPEVKGVELEASLPKADISLKGEVKEPDIDAKIPEGSTESKDSKGIDIKMKRSSFSFPKFGMSKPDVKADVSLPEVDTSLPEGIVEIKGPEIDAKIPEADVQYKDTNIQTSPTKFKLPTLKFPKFGVSAPKGSVEAPGLDIDVKGPEISVPDAELNISGKIPEVDIEGQNVDVQLPSIDVNVASEGLEVDGQGSKFKLPNFGISLPKVKGPEFDASVTKPDLDVSLPEGKVDVDASLPEGKAEIGGVDSKDIDVKMKRPGFSFPKFGMSKPDVPDAPDIDVNLPEVDASLPEGKVEIKGPETEVKIPEIDNQYKDTKIHTSPSKFKLPSFKFPKIGVSAPKGSVEAPGLDIDVKAPEVSLPDAELKVSGEVPEVDLKGQIVDAQPLSIDVSAGTEGPEVDGQGSKFKLPNFGISLPKGPEVDVSVSKPDLGASVSEGKVEVDTPLPEGKAGIPGSDSKGIDVKIKRPSFSFPKFGWSKPDVKAPVIDVSLPEVDTSLPEGKVEIKGPEIDAKIPEADVQYKDTNIQTSPTKFKLPTLKFPKFGVSAPKGSVEAPGLDIDVKGPEISVPDAELNISGKIPEVDIEGQNVDVQLPSIDVNVASEGLEVDGQGSKFKLPNFGISLPKVKGPEFDASVTKPDLDVSLPEGKVDVDASLPEGKAEIGGVDSKDIDVKMKRPGFSFPKFGMSKPDVPDAPDIDVNLPEVDASLPEGKVEIKGPETEVKIPEIDNQYKDTKIHTSPSKFKLPSFKFPKIGVSAPKGSVEAPGLDIDVKAPEVSLPDAELKVSGEVPAVELKGQIVDAQPLSIDMHVHVEGPDVQGSKLKFPKFGKSLLKVKGPEVDLSISKPDMGVSSPEGKVDAEAPLPEVATEISGVDSKGVDIKMKRPGFSFPKFGMSKPDLKAPDVDASLPKVDISLPEGQVEVKGTELDVKSIEGDVQLKDASAITSPTRFKLPTFKFPKIGVSTPKGEVDIDVKAPEVSGTDTELNVSMEVPTADVKGQLVDVQAEGHDVDGQGSKFKLPKFGISLPKVKDSDIDVSVSKPDPEGKIDVEAPLAEVKAEIPEVDSKSLDVKMKRSSFSFPKFGWSKPDVKSPDVDVTLPEADVSLPEGAVEIKDPGVGVQVAEGEVDLPEVDSKGIDVNIKKPSFSFPKFGFSKPDTKISEVDTTLPKAEMSLSEGNMEVKDPKMDNELEGEVKDGTISGSPSKYKLPTMKFPKFGVTVPKVEPQDTDVQMRGPDVPDNELKVSGEPVSIDNVIHDVDVDVQTVGVGTEGQGSKFKLPKFGVSLPKVKGSEVPKPEGEVSLPEGRVDMEGGVESSFVEAKVDLPEVNVAARKPGFSFPKFGFAKPEVKSSEIDGKTPQADVSKPEGIVEVQNVALDVKGPDDESAVASPTKFKLPTFKMPTFGGSAVKSTMEVTVDSSLPKGTSEVKPVDTDIKVPASEVTLDLSKSDVHVEVKEVKSRISFPKFGFSKPGVKTPEVEVTPPIADVTLPEASVEPEIDVKIQETESKGEAVVGGSPSKFKFPTIKMPKFGSATPKTNIEADVTVPEGDSSPVMIRAETDVPAVEGTVVPDNEVSTQSGESKISGSPSKYKLPTFKSLFSRAKSEEDAETPTDVKPEEVPLETGDKEITQVTDKSPKFTLPTVQDVLRGFDVEFHVPTLDEIDEPKGGTSQPGDEELKPAASGVEQDVEASADVQEKSKFALQFSKLGLTQASKDSDKVEKTDVTVKQLIKEEQKLELLTEQKLQDTQDLDASSEKGSWFKLPKFPSPTKLVQFKEGAKLSEEHEQNTESENLENEISITSSLRSSDAFADESSALTTEPIGPSLDSPTKVTVKYAEPISTGTGDVTTKIITSTTRTELISMEPDLPEMVNISFSSESSSMDTLRQESGAIHIITSNVQAIPETQQATILTDFESHAVSLPVEQVISTPTWSVQETSMMQKDSIVVGKRMIKEISSEIMETVTITQKTCVLDADSGEPISSTAASSYQTLRDTMHTEKMRFFKDTDMQAESTVVSSGTTERCVIKHSTEEHHGK